MSGSSDLAAIIRKIKRIPHLIKETAPECARSLDGAINKSLSAGHAPSGGSWAPLKATGGKALANAPGNATVTRAVGTTLVTATQFPYQFHNAGPGKLPKRQVIPSSLTPNLSAAIKKPLVDAFNAKIKGG